MPSRITSRRKDYNLVDDTYDNGLPLHNDEAFQHGITFKAKVCVTWFNNCSIHTALKCAGQFKLFFLN